MHNEFEYKIPEKNQVNILGLDFYTLNKNKSEFNNLEMSMRNSAKIINYLNEHNDDLLVYGDVQSGKTENLIATCFTSIDNGFRNVFLFGGTNNDLLNQTYDRLKKFDNNDGLLNIRLFSEIKNDPGFVYENKRNIILVMKEFSNVQMLLSFIEKCDTSKLGRTLIIDDEADFMSMNNAKQVKVKDDDNEITDYVKLPNQNNFEMLRELLGKIKQKSKVNVVQFTATPYVNVIKPYLNFASPQKMIVLERSDKYTGLLKFGDNRKTFVTTFDTDTLKEFDYYRSIIWSHLIRVSLFEYLHPQKRLQMKYTTMAINNSMRTADHKIFKEKLDKVLDRIKNEASTTIQLKAILRNENYKNIVNKYHIDKNYYELLKKNIDETSSYIMNSKNKFVPLSGNYIVIGGKIISRGYTLENLFSITIENIASKTNAADVLLQKARWFGYRQDIFDFVKIYMNQKTLSLYEQLLDLVEPFDQENAIKNEFIFDISSLKNIFKKWQDARDEKELILTQK